MYEKVGKEVKEAFKKTKYGKKTNKHMLIGAIAFLVFLIISVILTIILDNSFSIDVFEDNIISFNLNLICYFSYLITVIIALMLVYLDGKRDGAIKCFEENFDKKK